MAGWIEARMVAEDVLVHDGCLGSRTLAAIVGVETHLAYKVLVRVGGRLGAIRVLGVWCRGPRLPDEIGLEVVAPGVVSLRELARLVLAAKVVVEARPLHRDAVVARLAALAEWAGLHVSYPQLWAAVRRVVAEHEEVGWLPGGLLAPRNSVAQIRHAE